MSLLNRVANENAISLRVYSCVSFSFQGGGTGAYRQMGR